MHMVAFYILINNGVPRDLKTFDQCNQDTSETYERGWSSDEACARVFIPVACLRVMRVKVVCVRVVRGFTPKLKL